MVSWRSVERGGRVGIIGRSNQKVPEIPDPDELKQKLIAQDDFPWRLATTAPTLHQEKEIALKYVGGAYSKQDPSMACGTLVVLDIHTLQVVYEDHSVVTLSVPYVPGFLAFREAPVVLELLEKMKASANLFYPQGPATILLHHSVCNVRVSVQT
ncbi:hypothetical protein ACLB2K_019068 [Fragaria x ananassa]